MKNLSILFALISINVFAQSKIIGKVVYLNSKKQPAIGVEIAAYGSSGDTSKDEGIYILNFPNTKAGTTVYPQIGDEIVINGKTIKKIELVNVEKLKAVNIPSNPNKSPLKIIVCPKGYRNIAAQVYYKTIKSSSDKELSKLKKQITVLKQKYGTSNSLLQKKQSEFDRNQKMASDSIKLYKEALAYASINRDDAADRVLLFLDALDAGMDIKEARKELSTEKAFNEALVHEKGIEASLEEIEQDAKSLLSLYKFNQAIQKYDTINIILKHKMYNEILLVENLYKLGMLTQQLNYYNKAEIYYKEGLQILEKRTDYKSYKAHFLSNLANLQKNKNKFVQALSNHKKALQLRRLLAEENPKANLSDVASSLNNLAILQKAKNEFSMALKNHKESLEIRRALAKENPKTYLPDVAMSLHNLAVLQHAQNQFPQALKNYKESLKIYRILAVESSRAYLENIAVSLSNLAAFQKDRNEYPEAQENYNEALQINRKLAKENPRTFLPVLANSLFNLGNFLLAKNEFPEALKSYEEALLIRRSLAQENPKVYLPDLAMSLNNLALIQRVKNEYSESLKNYKEAVQIIRAFAEENPKVYLPYLATYLNDLALLLQDQLDFPNALKNLEEALQIRRELAKNIPKTFLPDVAKGLNKIANLQKNKKDFKTALKNYQEALEIYKSFSSKNPRIYLPEVATTLNNIAVLKQTQNKVTQAIKYYEEALQIYRPLAKEKPFAYNVNVAGTCISITTVKYMQLAQKFDMKLKNECLSLLKESRNAMTIYDDTHLAKKRFIKFIDDLEVYFLSVNE